MKRTDLNSALRDYAMIVIGCGIAAISFNLFLRPLSIASGGVVGISVLVKSVFGVEPAIVQWALNLPLFVVGLVVFGRSYGVKTALGSALLPLGIVLTRGVAAPTDQPLLAAVYAGLGLGLGLGLVFRGRGSTGGLSVLAQLTASRTGLAMGTALAAIDACVVGATALVMGAESAMLALIVVFITGRVVDVVRVGVGLAKVALVMSDEHQRLSELILKDLDRGLTRLYSSGGYTGSERPTLMVAMDPSQVVRFKTLVHSVDPEAFTILMDAHEVQGKGFRSRL